LNAFFVVVVVEKVAKPHNFNYFVTDFFYTLFFEKLKLIIQYIKIN